MSILRSEKRLADSALCTGLPYLGRRDTSSHGSSPTFDLPPKPLIEANNEPQKTVADSASEQSGAISSAGERRPHMPEVAGSIPASPTTVARFWSKVSVGSARQCWPWHAATDEKGYGRFNDEHAHRVAWWLVNGPIPDGLMILHSCDNPPCCNPRHLRPGTAQDNINDCWSRGRGVRLTGSRNGKTKLTDEQIAAVLEDPRKGWVIAREYGISQALVSMIRNGNRRSAAR